MSRRRLAWHHLVVLLALAGPSCLRAQSSNNGALDLLLPIGARATAMGSAFSAEQGAEAFWWNPAGVARVRVPQFSLDHFATTFVESGDAVSLILPAGVVGAFGIGARLFNYGSFVNTDINGNELGESSTRSIVLSGIFSTFFGSLVNAGVAFRLYQLSTPCSGLCDANAAAQNSPTTAAVDVGVQYHLSAGSPVTLGIALSGFGPNLQVHDQAQADQLPTRVRLGASVQPTSEGWDPNVHVKLTGEFVATPALSSPEFHMGGEISYASGGTALIGRGGYILQGGDAGAASTGPSIGFGIANKRVTLDFARIFESFSSGLPNGKPPTFVSVRVQL